MWVKHQRKFLGDKDHYWDGPYEVERAVGKGLYAIKIPHPTLAPAGVKEGYKLVEVVSDDMKPYPRLNPTHAHTLEYSKDLAKAKAHHAAHVRAI